MTTLISLSGRYGRAKYFWSLVFANILIAGTALVLAIVALENDYTQEQIDLLAFYADLMSIAVSIPIAVKRLHDLDRPGAHIWLLLLPIYNIWLSLVLLFQDGTVGYNRFGADPRGRAGSVYHLTPSYSHPGYRSQAHEVQHSYVQQDGCLKQITVAVAASIAMALITPTMKEYADPVTEIVNTSSVITESKKVLVDFAEKLFEPSHL
ncbi:MAG: DUF805 domain-containing protein [Caldilineaceae bacterium]|nr:DUF805 domain-containing protein [Caldilineaceae bacterium]